MNGHNVAMLRMMGSDAFNVWTKRFTRGFLRCDIIDMFEKMNNELFLRDLVWYERFSEELKIGQTVTIRIPMRLRS